MKILTVNSNKTVLSGQTAIYKTERFLGQTRAFYGFDGFLGKLAECVIERGIGSLGAFNSYCLALSACKFFFQVRNNNIVFFKYTGADAFIRRGDLRFSEYLKKDSFTVNLTTTRDLPEADADFLKLYRLGESEYVNFPLLDETQAKIVTTEDQNMLVQGVAGSGKTNLCIDKIVYSAGRGYAGRTLYSTFSRGLLADTKTRLNEFSALIKRLIKSIEERKVIFVDGDKVKAVENKLGIYLEVPEDKITQKLFQISNYLDDKVDYALIEDLYRQLAGRSSDVANEKYFVQSYVKDMRNHQLAGKLSKINYLSHEVVYKEIFGLISGGCDPGDPLKTLSLQEYTARRKDSFSTAECEIIYALAKDYFAHLQKNNLTDNNLMCRELLELGNDLPVYSLTVLDEVQDMTEVNLVFFKRLSRKMFCVGDALQMINASYFSFAYLKRLLYEKDISSVAELTSNYRNTKKIAQIAESLGKLNAKCFGVHSFVLKSKTLDTYTDSDAVYIKSSGNFLDRLNREAFNNYTIVISSERDRDKLRQRLTKQEILTVSEIKGLERDTVILFNILSSNQNRWSAFERASINRKASDENSVYRYYFNLLYVGVSRAKQRLYVAETERIGLFEAFFKESFLQLDETSALNKMLLNADKAEAEQDEILERIRNFITLGQYDNARFATGSIILKEEREREFRRIEVAERYISKGLYRDAGIRFLQLAMYEDAKKQFVTANDEVLASLAETCLGSSSALGLEVLSAFTELEGNEDARKIIVRLVNEDLQNMKDNARKTGLALGVIKS